MDFWTVGIVGGLATGMVLAVDRYPLASDNPRAQPQPEAKKVTGDGMQRQRAMCLVAMQKDGGRGDGDVGQAQHDQRKIFVGIPLILSPELPRRGLNGHRRATPSMAELCLRCPDFARSTSASSSSSTSSANPACHQRTRMSCRLTSRSLPEIDPPVPLADELRGAWRSARVELHPSGVVGRHGDAARSRRRRPPWRGRVWNGSRWVPATVTWSIRAIGYLRGTPKSTAD
jgi:hypothetical protein